MKAGTAFGMGQAQALATIKEVGEEPTVKAVREAVSPWLWVLSIASFGMSVLKTMRSGK